ncbi:hypothetical protein IMZ48_49915 [Candidatus Bathyarchaeota archaeon]|nr:hypothetical protein [Candidatus Bathyarchaeota archaeon]
MSLKSFLAAGFLAVTAIAAPYSPVSSVVEKRFEPGWCNFHLHQDESNPLDTKPTSNINTTLFNGQGNGFYTFPRQNI